jgi:hypothetical protein
MEAYGFLGLIKRKIKKSRLVRIVTTHGSCKKHAWFLSFARMVFVRTTLGNYTLIAL